MLNCLIPTKSVSSCRGNSQARAPPHHRRKPKPSAKWSMSSSRCCSDLRTRAALSTIAPAPPTLPTCLRRSQRRSSPRSERSRSPRPCAGYSPQGKYGLNLTDEPTAPHTRSQWYDRNRNVGHLRDICGTPMGGTPPLIPLHHEVSQGTPRSLRSALWLPGCPPEHLVPIPRPFPLQAKKKRCKLPSSNVIL